VWDVSKIMKPLLSENIKEFERRFNSAKDAELKYVTVLDPTTMCITIGVQDESRAFDWIDLELKVSSVSDARLVDENKFSFIDTSDGISIIYKNGEVIVAVGSYKSFEAAVNAPLFIKGGTLKYQENSFSA